MSTVLNDFFGYGQELAYSASISMIVSKQHYARATALASYITYSGSGILAPVLAGILYTVTGLYGILWIDLATFLIVIMVSQRQNPSA